MASGHPAFPAATNDWANVGPVDRGIRLILGLGLILAAGSDPGLGGILAQLVGLALVATAVVGFSLIYDTFGLDTRAPAVRDAPRTFAS